MLLWSTNTLLGYTIFTIYKSKLSYITVNLTYKGWLSPPNIDSVRLAVWLGVGPIDSIKGWAKSSKQPVAANHVAQLNPAYMLANHISESL